VTFNSVAALSLFGKIFVFQTRPEEWWREVALKKNLAYKKKLWKIEKEN